MPSGNTDNDVHGTPDLGLGSCGREERHQEKIGSLLSACRSGNALLL
jgi:hypothetical protein